MKVTLRELARAAGVSVSTVSRVLNNSDHAVSADVRERVLQLAAELGYQPNVSARTLRTDRSFTIGIVADDITPGFTTDILKGVEDTLGPAGYFCVIASLHGDTSLQQEALDALLSRGMDGILIVDTWSPSAIPYLQRLGTPYAYCQRLFGTSAFNSVIADNCYGGEVAVSHLLRAGHRRIGIVNGKPNYYMARDRLQGYITAHQRFGAIIDPALITSTTWEIEGGYEAARRLLTLSDRPTAIFATNDMLAAGTIYAAQDVGLDVPRELAVVGYDDQPIARFFRPKLTTVTYPCYEMGRQAAGIVLRRIAGEQSDAEEIALKGQLIVRESCGSTQDESALHAEGSRPNAT